MSSAVEKAYAVARERYAELGVDTEASLEILSCVSLSLPCWAGDDVAGFEGRGLSGGGIRATGGHPGRARNAAELRADLEAALGLLPGAHAVNLHAMYGEFGGARVDRDEIEPVHFEGWIDWARDRGIGLDFNATLFSHPLADGGFTLSSADPGVREFWMEHVRRARGIGARMGEALSRPCVHNLWIPDGMKDACVDRGGWRARLKVSLDGIYAESFEPARLKDAVESKLFGLGSESFTAGSHEFYLAYALSRGLMPCLDLGHFHPTESVADKISSVLLFCDELLLHLSRGVRWDSDHVPVLDDALADTAREIVRNRALGRVHLALDFFDASLNRVGAWVAGGRAVQKALLAALLEPAETLVRLEQQGDYLGRLALLEEVRALPLGFVWDLHCARAGAPPDSAWVEAVRAHEGAVQRKRV